MDQVSDENSCVSTIATTIVCTVFVMVVSAISFWTIYVAYWKRKYGPNRLIIEDPESAKIDYAFDNPAFKAGDNSKNVSFFHNKWKTPDKRKTVDDFHTNAPIPRLVPLRGSDFTGLGIEVCGGLKEGIYVKKVMSKGPAANIVHRGEKITSITIDFRHIVQEDATTILSYASPYNVQLELIEPSGAMSDLLTQNPCQSLLHPLYRSQSQEDLETIERNARKKLFTKDDNSYPTLKIDQQHSYVKKPRSPIEITQSHDEHEKKNSLKKIQNFIIDTVGEKLQSKSSHSPIMDLANAEKNSKSDKQVLTSDISKETVISPNKIQADNDNNANIEKVDIQPPEAMKRFKNKNLNIKKTPFERQASINSSGIKRDSAGIPQEMPAELMQAAITALNNRKVNSIDRKYKGMAPRPPNVESDESVDYVIKVTGFDNNFTKAKVFSNECSGPDEDKASSTDQNNTNAQQIELSSNYITVHQVLEEETSEERKTASLGDLSKLGVDGDIAVTKTNDETFEKAQSLEIPDTNNPSVGGEKIAPTQRNVDSIDRVVELEAPCSSEPTNENMEALQTVRLKSSYEWGNLEDVVHDRKECLNSQIFNNKNSSSSMDMMSEVLAAADKFDYEINDIQLSGILNDDLSQFEFELSKTFDAKPLPPRMKEEPVAFTISHKSHDLTDAHKEIAMQKDYIETECISSTQCAIESTDVKSPIAFTSEIGELNDSSSINTNSLSEMIQEIDVGNDAEVSKYALRNIERPKSEVLKRLILRKSPEEDFENEMDGKPLSPNVSMIQLIGERLIDITEMEPINHSEATRTESKIIENRSSPIFSSDFQGVSNISISSTDSFNEQQVSPFFTNSEKQSHTMEDKQINFKIQTVTDVTETDLIVSDKQSLTNEVFIVESLSSKKVQDSLLPISNGNSNSKSPTKGFVTEISFSNSNKDKLMNEKNFKKSLEVHSEDYDSMKKSTSIANPNCKFESQSVIVQEDYIPRNSEIRFTTSTYQLPKQFEKRSSQIDQIRSNFERSHTSEIPVPIRKISTSSTPPPCSHSAMTRVSPSKIPVFNSQKSSDNLRNNGSITNRVSITSIKNSSRNPSGK